MPLHVAPKRKETLSRRAAGSVAADISSKQSDRGAESGL